MAKRQMSLSEKISRKIFAGIFDIIWRVSDIIDKVQKKRDKGKDKKSKENL